MNESTHPDNANDTVGSASHVRHQEEFEISIEPRSEQEDNGPSIKHGNGKDSISNGPESAPSKAPTVFREGLSHLSPLPPHLRNVRHRSHRAQATLDCFDFSKGMMQSFKTFSNNSGSHDFSSDTGENLEIMLDNGGNFDLDTKLLVAEDLSSELIECLGSCLPINGEIFEEHLLDSGWRGSSGDPGLETWTSHRLSKDYFSLSLLRPIKQKTIRGLSEADRKVLLDDGDLKWQERSSVSTAWPPKYTHFGIE